MRANVYLRKRKTSKGESRYSLVVREYGRREKYIRLGPVSKKVAEERRLQVLYEISNGTYKREPVVHLYLGEFVEKFFTDFANGSRAPKSVQIYRDALNPVVKHFRGYRLSQITRHDIEKYFSSYNVSGRTKNILLSVLRLVFTKAVEWNYLSVSPMIGIKRFAESSRGSRALTPTELNTLWPGLTAWQKSVFRVMIYSGMRPGELSNLKFQDIDWDENHLAIVSDKTRKTKNRKTRNIPLSQDLREELLFLKDFLPLRGGRSPTDYKPREPHQREYVLCHEDGSRVVCFRHAIMRALKKRHIEGVTPHGLRKTFCSQLARYKVHPKVAQTLMGHSDVSLTMRVYTEIDDTQLKEAVNALPTTYDMRRGQLQVVHG